MKQNTLNMNSLDMVRKPIYLICFDIFQSKWYRNALIDVPDWRYDKHPYPFPIAFSPPPRSIPKNKDLPPSEKKKKRWFAPATPTSQI